MGQGPSGIERCTTLAHHEMIETAPGAALDDLVRLAAKLCDAPIGLITLIDEAQQLFAAQIGYDGPPVAPLDIGFCPVVVERGGPVIIPDTLADPAYAGNAATRDGGIRFYAGMPLAMDG